MEPETVPVCPLLSINSNSTTLCVMEHCAWYIAPVKKCALYVMGHNNAVQLQKGH